MSDFHVIIPARYQSTRLPGKPLATIGDKPMIVHVCDRAKESGALSVTVATDDQRILSEVAKWDYNAVMTREDHRSGSDRLYQAAELMGLNNEDTIVNLQGDEPFIPSENIALVASLLDQSPNKYLGDDSPPNQEQKQTCEMSTLACRIEQSEELFDPNIVKLVFDKNNQALYFSRSPVPYDRNNPITMGQALKDNYFRHIGIYAYKKSFLQKYIQWPSTPLELSESLEQLRVLEHGYAIRVACVTELPPHGVDTPDDLKKARGYLLNRKGQV